KSNHRYNIFIDDKYAFAVDEKILVEYKLTKGLKLEANEMIELIDAESLKASYVLAIQYLSYRQRSASEIEQYLLKKEVEPKHIELVMDRLNNEKLLDDLEFAKTFVQERIRQKKKGPKIISNELFKKGISKEKIDKEISNITFDEKKQIKYANTFVQKSKKKKKKGPKKISNKLFKKGISKEKIDKAISIMTFDEQYQIALDSGQKRANRPKKESVQKQKDQIRTYLMRNGFDNDVISEVMQNIIFDHDKEAEWDALKHHGEKMYRRYSKKSSGKELKQKLMSALYTRGFKGEQINQFI